jgi:hypothetical protein
MTGKPDGRVEVRPNTLRDQMAPNTFRAASAPRQAGGRQDLNRGGGRMARRPVVARLQTPRWMYVALGVLAIVIALYLLRGMP